MSPSDTSIHSLPSCGKTLPACKGLRIVKTMPCSLRTSSVSEIDSRFSQPHSLWQSAKPAFKVTTAPEDFRDFVTGVAERKNAVMVGLCQSRTVSRKEVWLSTISVKDRLIGFRSSSFQPSQQGRTKIETDPLVVIDRSFRLTVEDPCSSVGSVGFSVDLLVPVVKGMSSLLCFDFTGPGILPRRLIEMTVNTEKPPLPTSSLSSVQHP